MKILHIFKSEPGDDTRRFVNGRSEGREATEVALYRGPVDYSDLVGRIFENDNVVCWW